MSYQVRFHRKARAEFDLCCRTYPCMEEPLGEWLYSLAEEAEQQTERLSFDIQNLPPYLARAFAPAESSWQYTWERLHRVTWRENFEAILKILLTRKPPWELRAAWMPFPVLRRFYCMVVVFFDVDHVHRRIVVRLFDDGL